MTDVERKMTTDEIKGLLTGISSICCSTATSIDFSGTDEITPKMDAVLEYISRIEEKVNALKNSDDSGSNAEEDNAAMTTVIA